MPINKMLKLKTRPIGSVTSEHFELVEEQVAELDEGQILVKVLYLSFDPTQRGWLNDVKSYVPPVQIGEVMRAGSVGQVIETRDSNFSNGDTGYSRIALFYVDVAALPQYNFQEGKKSISFGPYLSYLGLSSLYIGEKKKAELNNLDIDPLDAGFVTYFTIHGPLASFQVGGKLGLKDVNNGINFDTYYPRTGKNGIIRNLSLEIGVLF